MGLEHVQSSVWQVHGIRECSAFIFVSYTRVALHPKHLAAHHIRQQSCHHILYENKAITITENHSRDIKAAQRLTVQNRTWQAAEQGSLPGRGDKVQEVKQLKQGTVHPGRGGQAAPSGKCGSKDSQEPISRRFICGTLAFRHSVGNYRFYRNTIFLRKEW